MNDYGVAYDYASIMHYGETFFSKDSRSTTLKPKKEGVQIGQRLGLSPLDILQANRLYMCRESIIGLCSLHRNVIIYVSVII